MAWCPKCRNEYREGITVCAECGCELVDELPEEAEETKFETSFDSEEMERRVRRLLEENGDNSEEPVEDGEETEETSDEEMNEDYSKAEPAPEPSKPYMDSRERAEEHKSSAVTLIGVGVVGLVVMILFWTGVISIGSSSAAYRYLTYGIMTALFVIFIILGISSRKSSKMYAKKAEKEGSLMEEMQSWAAENLTSEQVDAQSGIDESLSEEEKYFKRMETMKRKLTEQFENLEDGFAEHFLDDLYETVFKA